MPEVIASYINYKLSFKNPSGTSRGILTEKDAWFIILEENENPGAYGIGECSPLKGLSMDDVPVYQEKLDFVCENINLDKTELSGQLKFFPSIKFGLETAFNDLENGGQRIVFPSSFQDGQQGVPINGLVWMGSIPFMKKQLKEKIENGFSCIKIKIGALNFDAELAFLKYVRQEYGWDIELRLDANGAFSREAAPEYLKYLSDYKIHSIEQPIRHGQWNAIAEVCGLSPIPVALDEELIGVPLERQKELLEKIRPAYIILKPSLLGGFTLCDRWIEAAQEHNTGWWLTSALESNIGLNAIAQYTFQKDVQMNQGLGTGALFTNNIPSPLEVRNGFLYYNPGLSWQTDRLYHV